MFPASLMAEWPISVRILLEPTGCFKSISAKWSAESRGKRRRIFPVASPNMERVKPATRVLGSPISSGTSDRGRIEAFGTVMNILLPNSCERAVAPWPAPMFPTSFMASIWAGLSSSRLRSIRVILFQQGVFGLEPLVLEVFDQDVDVKNKGYPTTAQDGCPRKSANPFQQAVQGFNRDFLLADDRVDFYP